MTVNSVQDYKGKYPESFLNGVVFRTPDSRREGCESFPSGIKNYQENQVGNTLKLCGQIFYENNLVPQGNGMINPYEKAR